MRNKCKIWLIGRNNSLQTKEPFKADNLDPIQEQVREVVHVAYLLKMKQPTETQWFSSYFEDLS